MDFSEKKYVKIYNKKMIENINHKLRILKFDLT